MGDLTQNALDELLKGSSLDSSNDYISKFNPIIKGLDNLFSSSLSTFLSCDVKVSKDETANSYDKSQIIELLDDKEIFSKFSFSSGSSGNINFLFDKVSSLSMASLMLGDNAENIDDQVYSAICEVASTFVGSICTDFSGKLKIDLSTEPCEGLIVSKDEGIELLEDDNYFVQEYHLFIESEEKGSIKLILPVQTVKEMISFNQKKGENMGNINEKAQQVQFSGFNSQGSQLETPKNINLLMDVYMEMTVELGRTKRLIKDILTMGEGTIIELDKIAGEPADILVNHKLVARGEVVVIDENFGIRVTEIISQNEKVNPF